MRDDDGTEHETAQVSAVMSGNASLSVSGWSIGTALSMSHLHAAAYLARESRAIETEQKPSSVADIDTRVLDHRAAVMGAVFMSVAFLDASINEECDSRKEQLSASPHWAEATGVANKWKRTPPTTPEDALEALMKVRGTLDRFHAFLTLLGQRGLGPGDAIYGKAVTLCELRHRLVHYEAIWEEFPARRLRRHRHNVEDLQGALQAEFPAVNPLLPPDATWLYHVLNHACAEWVVRTAMDFREAFYVAADIPRPYDLSSLHLDLR